jgi:hypothetical protein
MTPAVKNMSDLVAAAPEVPGLPEGEEAKTTGAWTVAPVYPLVTRMEDSVEAFAAMEVVRAAEEVPVAATEYPTVTPVAA